MPANEEDLRTFIDHDSVHDSTAFDGQDLDLEDKLLGGDELDEKVLDGAEPDATPNPILHTQEPVYAQPVNRATHVCLRGPCIHYWPLIGRFVAPGDTPHIKVIRQCNCHYEETNLGGQNIYSCGKWWPQWLAWVPESFRGVLRPKLTEMYVEYLKKEKYDFSWKTWKDDVFDSDRPDLRTSSGLGGKRITSIDES